MTTIIAIPLSPDTTTIDGRAWSDMDRAMSWDWGKAFLDPSGHLKLPCLSDHASYKDTVSRIRWPWANKFCRAKIINGRWCVVWKVRP